MAPDDNPVPFALAAGAGERLRFGGVEVLIRLAGEATGGRSSGFFRELAAADRAGDPGPDAYAHVSARYGITWLT